MENERDILNPLERFGQIFIIFGMLLLAGYLYLHQLIGTGFFTADFGLVDKLALYGPILLSLGAPLVRLVTGRSTLAFLFEALTNFALALGAYWLLRSFPFDFSHLADPLPAFLRWPIAWVRDPIARIILWAQLILGALTGLSNSAKFLRRLDV